MEADSMKFHAALIDMCILASKDKNLHFSEMSQKYKEERGHDFTRFLLIENKGSIYVLADHERRELYYVVIGSIFVEGLQLYIKKVSIDTFSALEVLEKRKKEFKNYDITGVGYSSGACIVGALADIIKQMRAICFNPLGLGEIALRNINSLKKFGLTPDPIDIEVYKIEGDSLSKYYISPGDSNRVHFLPNRPGLHPHSILNFLNYQIPEIHISTSKYFPTIKKISFDPKSGFLLIETEKSDENLYIEGDLATIFYMAYEYPKRFSFTLVPSDPKAPQGPYQRKFYDPPELEDTTVGSALFEADWKLKQLDQGLWFDDTTQQRSPISLDIPWFKSGYDYYASEPDHKGFIRLWFVNDKVDFDYFNAEDGIVIDPKDFKIRVEAMKLQMNVNSEFGLEDTNEETITKEFAAYVTDHFDELASLIPEFHRLKQISLLSAAAEWFRDVLKVPKDMIDTQSLKLRMPKVEDFYPKGQVPRIQRKEQRIEGDYAMTLIITGGINLISQNTEYHYEAHLQEILTRDIEVLSPFHITHYDYVNDLLEYDESTEDEFNENEPVMCLVQLMQPHNCSYEGCNSIVEFDSKTIETTSDSNAVYNEINKYTYLGKLYCLEHHPFRCGSENCQLGKVVISGQPYFEAQGKTFHSECLICYACKKPINTSIVLKERGFLHPQCVALDIQMGQEQKSEEVKKNDENFEIRRKKPIKTKENTKCKGASDRVMKMAEEEKAPEKQKAGVLNAGNARVDDGFVINRKIPLPTTPKAKTNQPKLIGSSPLEKEQSKKAIEGLKGNSSKIQPAKKPAEELKNREPVKKSSEELKNNSPKKEPAIKSVEEKKSPAQQNISNKKLQEDFIVKKKASATPIAKTTKGSSFAETSSKSNAANTPKSKPSQNVRK
ncbi:unnamed protein product [Blepharisma stoltei]|uniref:LIM zinc-binding domain-containing protein n=1 Tax=Blepharisma stoltei TaxID=1481888 RepID=A0AAU9JMF0_9CILI|nr:unnamed protein product [Blepharisma stoltei]